MRRSLQTHVTLTSGLSTVCNTTNSTNNTSNRAQDRPRVTTPRQDRFILRHHLQDRFTTTTDFVLVIPLDHSKYAVRRRWPARISIVDVLIEVLFLQTVTDRDGCHGPQLVNIGAINNVRESSSQMKVGSVFRRRMAEYVSSEEEVNVTHMLV